MTIDPSASGLRHEAVKFLKDDKSPKEGFNDLLRLACTVCDASLSIISFFNGEQKWFTTEIGPGAYETKYDLDFCMQASLQDELLVIPDVTEDNRFQDSPSVSENHKIKFYAGIPLKDSKGISIGSFCVLDRHPRHISAKSMSMLKLLASQAVKLIELMVENQKLNQAEERNRIFVEQAPTAMAMFDTHMNYLAASPKWLEDYNLNSANIKGKSHYEIFPEIGEDWKEIHQKCLQGDINKCEEAPFQRADGTIQWIAWDVRPWYKQNNEIGGLLMFTAEITKIKQRDAERVRIQNILSSAQSVALIGTWDLDKARGKIKWSSMTREIFEVPNHYEPTLPVALGFIKDQKARLLLKDAIDLAYAKHVSFDYEIQIVTALQKTKWIRFIGQPDFENENCKGVYGIIQDIDKQKKIQNDLILQERQFRGAFENSGVGMALLSIGGRWLKANKTLCEFLGYPEDELLRKTFQQITHPEDLESDMIELRKLVAGEIESYTIEKRYIHKSGRIVWGLLSVCLVKDATGSHGHFVSQIQDITGRRLYEDLLLETNQKLQALLDSGQVAIMGTNTEGIITHFNVGAENLLGYNSREIVGLQTPLLIHDLEEVNSRSIELTNEYGELVTGFEVLVKNAKLGRHESRQWTYVRKNGSRFQVQLAVSALYNSQRNINGFLCVATDITDRVEAQQVLKDSKDRLEILTKKLSNQNNQLANFAHITSHNLRAPASNLNSLLNMYYTTSSAEEKDEIFEKFERVIVHLSTTLEELSTALDIQDEGYNVPLEDISFQDTFKKVMEMVAGEIINSKAKIETDFSKAPTIYFNRAYLESIFLNLITNALKYRCEKRNLIVKISTSNKNGQVVLQVEDNGKGIDLKKHKNKLFGLHKTFHRNSDSRGVGLFLTKTHVESLGGQIVAESEVDKGSMFSLYFNPRLNAKEEFH